MNKYLSVVLYMAMGRQGPVTAHPSSLSREIIIIIMSKVDLLISFFFLEGGGGGC